MEYKVNQEKIDFFRTNGFVQLDAIISPKELEEIREALGVVMQLKDDKSLSERVSQGEGYYKVLNQKIHVGKDSPTISKYTYNPRFANIALQLSGAKGIRLLNDQAFWKMPGDSKPTGWHQDSPYLPWNEGGLSMWMALDDVDENNGCMMFLPGSHKLGRKLPTNLLEPEDLSSYVKGSEFETTQPVVVRMKAGSYTFHNYSTFHYAYANNTDKPRRVLSNNFLPDGITYRKDVEGVTAGEKVKSQLYPLMAGIEED